MALSRERIADELLKLLALPDPAPTVRRMVEAAILAPVLPEIGGEGVAALDRLVAAERACGVAPDALRRLAALLPPDPATADAIGARLKLSNAQRQRLRHDAVRETGAPRALAYAIGHEAAIDRILLGQDRDRCAAVAALAGWERPMLGLGGGALIALGLPRGPVVAETLQAIERRWVAEGFPPHARVEAIAREEVALRLGEV